jgi:hypothetical protein
MSESGEESISIPVHGGWTHQWERGVHRGGGTRRRGDTFCTSPPHPPLACLVVRKVGMTRIAYAEVGRRSRVNTNRDVFFQHFQGRKFISQMQIRCAKRLPLATSNTDPGNMQLVFVELHHELHLGCSVVGNRVKRGALTESQTDRCCRHGPRHIEN